MGDLPSATETFWIVQSAGRKLGCLIVALVIHGLETIQDPASVLVGKSAPEAQVESSEEAWRMWTLETEVIEVRAVLTGTETLWKGMRIFWRC